MINIKHLMDAIEPTDGERIWVEPVGLTLDLKQWCQVSQALPHLGPPVKLWEWFERHPDGYDYFRAKYHQHLSAGAHRTALETLARSMQARDMTLLHQGDDPLHNTATALYEFLSELSAYCPPEE